MVEYKSREVFRQGHGVYVCRSCGKRTRGNDESVEVELCGRCYDVASLENSLSDGIITRAKFDKGMAQIAERYGGK